MGVEIRPIEEGDIQGVIALYRKVYGDDFPFKQFYEPTWVRKGIYDDDLVWSVAELDGRIVGSAAVMVNVGDHDDLIGEFGRLVVDPDARGHGVGQALGQMRVDAVSRHIEFGFAEARAVHPGAQKIMDRLGFAAIGFEPMKYVLRRRESVVFFGRHFGNAAALRKNNPQVISAVHALGSRALENMGLEPDLIVKAEVEPYPSDLEYEIVELQGAWSHRLLRIEQGRVVKPEVFGGMHLDYGYLKIKAAAATYLVAREHGAPVGAIGFTIDDIDRKCRIFELIEFDDAVKGFLLRCVTERAETQYGCDYIEVDVNAHSPRLQCTLDLLGYVPVAYCPAMVFHTVERLDVVKMAKVVCDYELGGVDLIDNAKPLFDIVNNAMVQKKKGVEIDSIMARIGIFEGLDWAGIDRIGRICTEKQFKAGETVFAEGSEGAQMYVVTRGSIEIRDSSSGDGTVAAVRAGEIFGEFALIDALPRSMSAVCVEDATVLVIAKRDFDHLMAYHPSIGSRVYRNIAATLVGRLRRTNVSLALHKLKYETED
ncbi:MAG: GNAT family N-acetyltransferase [Verrucomicrobia bacterium]|nr:GNAT family N-acetyltransferase [Verrucomicrobiota bacterium]